MGTLGVLRHRRFAAFFVAASLSNGGSWMQSVAVPVLLFDLTGKAAWIGIASMAMLLPAVLITPYAGVLSDRVSRRAILLVTQSVQMAAAFALFVMVRSGDATPWRIVGLGLVSGIAAGFQTATWQSFVPLLVPAAHMLDAVRLNSLQFTLARAIGPGLAGIVIAAWGIEAAILVNAVTYPLVLAVLVVSRPRASAGLPPEGSVRHALMEGWSYVWHERPIRLAVILAFVSASLGQSPQHIGAAIAERIYGQPSRSYALLLATLGVSAALTSLVLTRFTARVGLARQAVVALSLYTVSLLMIVATDLYWVGFVAYFIGGIAHLASATTLNLVVQGRVPDALRGRVVSFYVLGILLGIPVGAYAVGAIGDVIGLRWALTLAAAALAAFTAGLTWRGSLRCFDR